MKRGISGKPIPARLPFASEVTAACAPYDLPPCLVYAIRQNETDSGTDPAVMQIGSVGDFMPDGSNAGHGVMELTSSWPSSTNPAHNWDNALANIEFAIEVFIWPAWTFWTTNTHLNGDDLIRCICASYNAGISQAWDWHVDGDVDSGTTNRYGARALALFHALIS